MIEFGMDEMVWTASIHEKRLQLECKRPGADQPNFTLSIILLGTNIKDMTPSNVPGMVNCPNQSNGSSSGDSTDHTHLQPTSNSSQDILSALPSSNDTRLDVTKRQKRDSHNPNTIVQRHDDLVKNKIWN